MSDVITLTGVVATPPNTVTTSAGLTITHFRLASNNRRFDRATQKWVDGESNFYSISAFRQTALNVVASLIQGDRVVVTGRLRLKDWASGDRTGVTAEVDADAIGHDLTWGSSHFTKVRRTGTYQEDSSPASFPTAAELDSTTAQVGSAPAEQHSEIAPDGTQYRDQSHADQSDADEEDAEADDAAQDEVEVDVERASIGPMHASAPF